MVSSTPARNAHVPKNLFLLVIRNRPLDADSGLPVVVVWSAQCRNGRSVVGRVILVTAVCRAWNALGHAGIPYLSNFWPVPTEAVSAHSNGNEHR